jgi:uncharacterized protein YjbJ (UPF0337 family)
MRTSRRIITKGIYHEVRGTFRNFIGRILSNRILGVKGSCERVTGKTRKSVGRVFAICGF